MNYTGYAILVDKKVVNATVDEWARWFNSEDRHVGYDFVGEYRVSTVFLGSDHGFGEGAPLWFETMIFGADENDFADQFMYRYTTWEDADRGHKLAVQLLQGNALESFYNVYQLPGTVASE